MICRLIGDMHCFACFITYLRLSLFNDIFVQGGNDENAYSKQAKVFGQENQPFTIFVDEAANKPAVPKQNNGGKLKLSHAVTSLPVHHEPISVANDIICVDDSLGMHINVVCYM